VIRYTLLTFFVAFLSAYAFKDWYKSLCGLIMLMAIFERSDMPRQMLGVTGLNPWNVLMLFILIGWFISRKREQLKWDMPGEVTVLLLAYVAVVLIGFVRMTDNIDAIHLFFINSGSEELPTLRSFFNDYIINSLKYVLPGILLFYGCNSEDRVRLGILAIFVTLFVLGLQIIRMMPISEIADGEALSRRALRVLDRDIGYHRVDLAALMAGGSWALFISRQVFKSVWQSRLTLGLGFILILALALTGGRAGYATWVILGVVVASLKYRRLLFFIPIAVFLVVTLVPAVRERMMEGFGGAAGTEVVGEQAADLGSITSGRVTVWQIVIDRIKDRPMTGWGRRGFHASGASDELFETAGPAASTFYHPHNAYLQLVLDNGLIGAIPILLFFGLIMKRSATLFRDKAPIICAAGGTCLLLTGAQLVASVGSQSFYPRAGVVLMWCSIGLMYAVYVRSRYRKPRGSKDGPTQEAA